MIRLYTGKQVGVPETLDGKPSGVLCIFSSVQFGKGLGLGLGLGVGLGLGMLTAQVPFGIDLSDCYPTCQASGNIIYISKLGKKETSLSEM